ncbi:F-box domain containing protein, partial [Tanacetum coccineum]
MSSADVARSHGDEGGGEDCPPPPYVPTGCGGCFINRGKGKRKPDLGGRGAGRLNTRDKTRNLSLKEIAEAKGPVLIHFDVGDKQTLNPLGVCLCTTLLGRRSRRSRRRLISNIGTLFDLRPHMESFRWTDIYEGINMHLQKAYNTKHWKVDPQTGTYDVEAIRRARPEEITTDEWDNYIRFWNDPKNLARAAQNQQNRQKSVVISRQGSRSLARLRDEMRQASDTQEYPSLIDTFWRTHTVDGVFPKDEDRRIYEEMKRLEATGEYTEDEINRLAREGKLRGHFPGVGRVLPSRATSRPSMPALDKSLKSIHKKVDFMMSLFRSDSKYSDMFKEFESGGASGSGGCGDDEESGDDEEGEDEDGDGERIVIWSLTQIVKLLGLSLSFCKKIVVMASDHKGIAGVLMGLSGADKSTIGEMLGKSLNCSFIDADDFHPQSNKETFLGTKRTTEGKHFMPAKLLQSQIDLLMVDDSEGIIKVDASSRPEAIYAQILDRQYIYEAVKHGKPDGFYYLQVEINEATNCKRKLELPIVEAEYIRVANAVAETVLLSELHSPLHYVILVHCDNVIIIYLTVNLVRHLLMKHIEIDIHFVLDMFFAQPPNTLVDKKDSDFDEILDDLFSVGVKNLRRMGQEKVQNGRNVDTSGDTNHKSGNLLNIPIFPTTNEFSSICEQDVDLEKKEAEGEDDDDDGDTYDIWDITVEDVERIRQFLMPSVPDEMDDVIQPLIPQPIHTRPPNDDYVAPATKSILDELLEEF